MNNSVTLEVYNKFYNEFSKIDSCERKREIGGLIRIGIQHIETIRVLECPLIVIRRLRSYLIGITIFGQIYFLDFHCITIEAWFKHSPFH